MSAAGRAHVLVMDEAPDVRDFLRELLTGEGYRVTTAAAVLEPEQVRRLAPDLIVLDPRVGEGGRGWRFLERTRLDPVLGRVPVVVCTAAVRTAPALQALLAPRPVAVVLKPFDTAEVLAEVAARLPRRDRHDGPDGDRQGHPRAPFPPGEWSSPPNP